MRVKLLVTNENEPSRQVPYEFSQEIITIGRDDSNILQLIDPKRIVGRKHAQIVCRAGKAQLVDVGSKNFTFFNKERLEAGRVYSLYENAKFNIGEYVIQFLGIFPDQPEAVEDQEDETRLGVVSVNPFLKEVNQLAGILGQIIKKYATISRGREDALATALLTMPNEVKTGDVGIILAQYLHPEIPDQQPVRSLKPDEIDYSIVNNRFISVIDTIFEAIINLLKNPADFRLEFFGETYIQTSEPYLLSTKSLNDLKEFLFSPEISEKEFSTRLLKVKEAVGETAFHQTALLDGYKTGVSEGSYKLIQQLDPTIIKEELRKKSVKLGPIKIPYHFLPFFFQWQVWQTYHNRFRRLLTMDRSKIENNLFRPEFTHGYWKHMATAGYKKEK